MDDVVSRVDPPGSLPSRRTYFDGHQHPVTVGTEVGALGQVDLPEGPFAQLPLEYDVLALDVLNAWLEDGDSA